MPKTLTGSAAEPSPAELTAPTPGGDTGDWGDILNDDSLQGLLNFVAWLYANKAALAGATFTGTVDAPTLQEGGTDLSAIYAALAGPTFTADVHLDAGVDVQFDDYLGHIKFRTADGTQTAARLRMSTGGGNALDIVSLYGDVKITAGSTNKITLWNETELQEKPLKHVVPASLGTTGTLDLDFAASQMQKIGDLTGDLTLTTSNLAAGRTMEVRITNGGTLRNLTFPAGWTFVGAKPASIAADKTAVLALSVWGNSDSDVVAAWAVEE